MVISAGDPYIEFLLDLLGVCPFDDKRALLQSIGASHVGEEGVHRTEKTYFLNTAQFPFNLPAPPPFWPPRAASGAPRERAAP